jgi:hypothetical protein
VTPKDVALAAPPSRPRDREAGGPEAAGNANRTGLETILVEERDGAIYFARIRDLGRFMKNRELHVHADVLKTLSDLVLSLVGEEDDNGSGSRG